MLEWISGIIARLGYAGIAFLMFAENVFPPIPSELIMPLAGYTASKGQLVLLGAIIAGVLGTMLGALPWFFLGRYFGTERLVGWADRWGKYAGIRGRDIRRADSWFDKYDRWVVLFGRLLPGVRTLISVPAGSCGMPFWEFVLFSTIGSTIWCAALAGGGMLLGERYHVLEHYIGPLSKIILGLIIISLVGVVLWKMKSKRQQKA